MYYEMPGTRQAGGGLSRDAKGGGVRAVLTNGNREVCIPVSALNTLVTGTTRYGKTVFVKEYVRERFRQNPGMYAVFFQIKPDDFTREFMRPRDKVITFSDRIFPKENLFKWCLVKEIRQHDPAEWDTELREISTILFSDLMQDRRNLVWVEGARSTFEAFIKVILYRYTNNPSNKTLISSMKNSGHKKFLAFLAEYAPNRSMLMDNFDYDPDHCDSYRMPRKGSDILFFLQNILEKFGGSFLSETGGDTIYEYMRGAYGERLFIVHDHKSRASSTLFEQYFLKYIGDHMLSLTSDFKGEMMWVLDEIDKIEHDFGLTQAVTLGQQFGLQVLVSTQSLESLYAVAPELNGEHLTNASLAGFPVTVSFHPGDPHTIETLQKLYGERWETIMTTPLSRYDRPVVKVEKHPVVKDADFAGLGVGECYVKIRSGEPERVRILRDGDSIQSDGN
ncbi:MAG: type IV secretion system DNA-binding domain-containing protein [Eubacteriales bacterium]|nr:type IV secretion system DNA-binding domain-containing protein [Eubacteriales bacterium]